MSSENRHPRAARDQTDESLQAERQKADHELAAIEDMADAVVARARARADGVLAAARDLADRQAAADPGVHGPAVVAEARVREDDSLQKERETSDETLRQERETADKTLHVERDRHDALLSNERQETDKHLSTERAEHADDRRWLEHRLSQSDEALAASRALERRSRHDALHDAVTGLPNMTLFHDRLANALAQAQRHGRRFAVLFVDMDHFKRVNDTHGHDAGDRILQVVAQRLRASIRGGDTASRRGGDEFVILALEADAYSASVLAARIESRIADTCDVDGVGLTVTASIGISLYPENGATAQELLKHADMAMYAGKGPAGRPRN